MSTFLLFKQLANKTLTRFQIILFQPATEVRCAKTQREIIKQMHENILSGHCGIQRTILKIKQRYYWKGMHNMVKDYISTCHQCQLGKTVRHTKEPLVLTDTPQSAFETVEIDTIGALPLTENGNRYAVTFQCNLTKFIDAVPVADKSAPTVAKAIVEHFLLKYGICKTIKTDMGTEYVNQILEEICNQLKVNRKTSKSFHHESLGSLERNHRVLNEFFRTCESTKTPDWDKWLAYYVFSFNTTPSTAHNFTPYELVFGKLPNLPIFPTPPLAPIYDLDDYRQELRHRLAHAQVSAKEALQSGKINQIAKINEKLIPSDFKVGQSVKLKKPTDSKWKPPYAGPFKIVSTEGVNSTISNDKKVTTVHNNRLRRYNER